MHRPIGAVWLRPMAHPGGLSLWLADQPIHDIRQPAWPLAERGTADFSAPIPLGTDERGRMVAVRLPDSHVLIAGNPRTGVSRTAQLLALGVALDPTVELHIFDSRATGDFDAIGRIADRYLAGSDAVDLAAMTAELAGLREQMRQRLRASATVMARQLSGAGKTEPASPAATQRPVVVVIEEAQELLRNSPRGEAIEAVTDLLRRGATASITMVLATCDPAGTGLATEVLQSIPVRICHRVTSSFANDVVLGTGAWASGVRATDLGHHDQGIGILIDRDGQPTTVRGFYTDSATAKQVAGRAAKARRNREEGRP